MSLPSGSILEGVPYGWWRGRGAERWWGRELGRQAVGQEGCGAA